MKKYNEAILKDIKEIQEVFNEGLTIIQPDTKMFKMINNYVTTRYFTLRECYGSYSYYKAKAYNHYYDIYMDLTYYGNFKGVGFGIDSYNTNQFTLCMKLVKNNILYKMYITKCYNRIIAVEEA